MIAEIAHIRDVRDAAKKQLDEGVIGKLLQDVAHLQNERSAAKRPLLEEPLGFRKRSRVAEDVDDLGLHLSQTRVEDAAVPLEGSNKQVEHLAIS